MIQRDSKSSNSHFHLFLAPRRETIENRSSKAGDKFLITNSLDEIASPVLWIRSGSGRGRGVERRGAIFFAIGDYERLCTAWQAFLPSLLPSLDGG